MKILKQKFSNLWRTCILKHSGVPTMTSFPSTLRGKNPRRKNFRLPEPLDFDFYRQSSLLRSRQLASYRQSKEWTIEKE